ncbi:hypothetical protein GCM10027084_12950 [Pseudoxanthomonas sangjuensis]|nr:hypothetical protein [Pseudoxanthomonas sangjuensis]
MLHIVHLIERRFPDRPKRAVASLLLLSASALALGIGLLQL